jgi:sugar phosphate isomerase/epimerase
VKLGLTQYAASADGRDFVDAAATFGVAGVEPFIANDQSEFFAWDDRDIARFASDARQRNIEVPSVALGLFNNDPSLIDKKGRDRAVEVIQRAMKFTAAVGAEVMLLCGYLASNPDTAAKRENLASVVNAVQPLAVRLGIVIALELPLPARLLADLVDGLKFENIGVYYDFGNAVALGFDPVNEVKILGNRIRALHVKDSADKLGALHFGEGRLKLGPAMKAIQSVGYDGWVMVETFCDDKAKIARDIGEVRQFIGASR